MTTKLLMPLLLVALVSGCGRSTKDREAITHVSTEADAIKTVLRARLDARKAVSNWEWLVDEDVGEKSLQLFFDKERYLALLKKIDVTQCPPKFQWAWDGYLSAWQSQLALDAESKKTGVKNLVKIAAAPIHPAMLLDLENPSVRDLTTPAFRECQRVEADYGFYDKDVPIDQLVPPPKH